MIANFGVSGRNEWKWSMRNDGWMNQSGQWQMSPIEFKQGSIQ